MIGSVLFEVKSRGESQLATVGVALDDARGASLMFHNMSLKDRFLALNDFAAELALKLFNIAFRGILLAYEISVIG